MSDDVKNRRSYVSQRRQLQAKQTRQAILNAAQAVFMEFGYSGATMSTIAERAGVALETVYAAAGSKPILLRTIIDMAIAGGEDALPALERDYVRLLRSEPNAARKLEIYANALGSIHTRVAPLFLVLAAAASSNPEAHALWRSITERRAANMQMLAQELASSGGLRADISVEEAGDILWATNGTEFFDLLVSRRGWQLDRYASWLASAWKRLLLP